jgi:hypothetical protein
MKIAETEWWKGFELQETEDGVVLFCHEENIEIGFDKEQAKQIVKCLLHWIEIGEVL